MIYFDMADRKERFETYKRGMVSRANESERKKQGELNDRIEAVWRVVRGLDVLTQLKEVRDSIWEEGTITSKDPDKFYPGAYLLSTSWAKFAPEHEEVSYGYDQMELTTKKPAYVTTERVVLSIEAQVSIKPDVKGYWTGWEPDRVWHEGIKSEWDGKSIYVMVSGTGVKESEASLIIYDSSIPINQSQKEAFEESINKVLAAINSEYPYPLAKAREVARNEIIAKVLSGKLSRNALPADFGYNFPPEAVKIQPVDEVKKRKGLFHQTRPGR